MTVDVANRITGGSTVHVGQFNSDFAITPTITVPPVITDASAFTITGLRFSGAGNHVFVNGVEVAIDTESTTSIVTEIFTAISAPMTVPVDVWVVDSGGVESNRVAVTILPRAGQAVFRVTATPGNPEFRLETIPDLEISDEILVRAVTGVAVDETDVHVDEGSAVDVAAAVVSHEYASFDGTSRSATWAPVNWAAVTSGTSIVPNVVGSTEADALVAAASNGLVGVVQASVYSAAYPAGIVIGQFPAPGDVVLTGSTLELTVSLGLAALTVPDLTGLLPSEADAALESIGLDLGLISFIVDGDNTGLIVGQNIAQGTVLPAGSTIDVTISGGEIPDVVGLLLLDAVNILTAANLVVADTTDTAVNSNTVPAGYVISQDPVAGAAAVAQQVVTLVVSLGPLSDLLEVVPYLIGREEYAARMRIESIYCIPEVTGSGGTVVTQSPAAFTLVNRHSPIQITMGGPFNFSRSDRRRKGLPTYGTPERP